ncbi:hypothetical protein [Streptomyces cupreus]|uniref:DUF2867 domain-containing protein n=1 Tax=Streptomyces cupreus TaxID=2759956 RepID=A0A7X1MBH4_9ACTN|nr:hypothetical protein [Streptomyces cupreus]MBC2905197.1 hypothetical protein [Streptomyces cupreus]
MTIAALPYVDEHTMIVAADPDALWEGLTEALDASFGAARSTSYARLVGCADVRASGPRPLAEGSTLPGFRVEAADRGRELVLIGRHRYSIYALTLHIDEAGPGRYLLRAETRAAFPGLSGRLYRRLAIGTGGHAMGIRRLLASIRDRAERPRPSA